MGQDEVWHPPGRSGIEVVVSSYAGVHVQHIMHHEQNYQEYTFPSDADARQRQRCCHANATALFFGFLVLTSSMCSPFTSRLLFAGIVRLGVGVPSCTRGMSPPAGVMRCISGVIGLDTVDGTTVLPRGAILASNLSSDSCSTYTKRGCYSISRKLHAEGHTSIRSRLYIFSSFSVRELEDRLAISSSNVSCVTRISTLVGRVCPIRCIRCTFSIFVCPFKLDLP